MPFFFRRLPWWIIVSELHWWWLFIVVTHALNSEWTNSELIERTWLSCSGTENSEFPVSWFIRSEFRVRLRAFWNRHQHYQSGVRGLAQGHTSSPHYILWSMLDLNRPSPPQSTSIRTWIQSVSSETVFICGTDQLSISPHTHWERRSFLLVHGEFLLHWLDNELLHLLVGLCHQINRRTLCHHLPVILQSLAHHLISIHINTSDQYTPQYTRSIPRCAFSVCT